jgi:hypothetical protein
MSGQGVRLSCPRQGIKVVNIHCNNPKLKKKTHEGWRHLAGFVAKGSCAANSRAAIARPVIYDASDLQPPPGPEHVTVLRRYLSQTKARGVKIKMTLCEPKNGRVPIEGGSEKYCSRESAFATVLIVLGDGPSIFKGFADIQ